MRISDIAITTVAVPNRQPLIHADGVISHCVRHLLEVRTDEGITGLGEVPKRVAAHTVEMLARRAIGADVFHLRELRRRVCSRKFYVQDQHAVFAALEMACLDIQGRALDRPVYDLLGGGQRDEIAMIAYVYEQESTADAAPVHGSAELAEAAHSLVDRYGFGTVKLKGGVAEPAVDIATSHLTRERLPDVALRLDPNGSWTVPTSLEVAHQLAGTNLEWLEDPTLGVLGMSQVTARSAIPTATNMCLTHLGELPAAVRVRATDVVLLDLWYAGGLRSALTLADAAEPFGIAHGIHSSGGELGVALAAMVHLAAALPSLDHAIDSHYHELVDDVVAGGMLPIRNGRLTPPQGPGLGVRLDRDKVATYAELVARLP